MRLLPASIDSSWDGACAKVLRRHGMLELLRPKVRCRIREWIESNIDLSRDRTAARPGFVRLSETPYLIDVVESWEKPTVRTIAVMGTPQTGKTSGAWLWPSLWAMVNDPGPMLTVYQNQPIATRTNRMRVEPVMEGIPKLKRELENPNCRAADEYRFSDMYWNFQGAGAPITSIPYRYVIADEPEYWSMANDVSRVKDDDEARFVGNLTALEDRVTSFGETYKMVWCCTPQTISGPIWEIFTTGSRGYYHMRCLRCEGMIPTYQVDPVEGKGGLRWEREGDGVVEASLRYVCPVCGMEHTVGMREEMLRRGGYVHERPELVDVHPSFQWGQLASMFVSWGKIARARLKAARVNTLSVRMHYRNTVEGMPFAVSAGSEEAVEGLLEHCRAEVEGELDEVYFGADTQDDGWFWVVGGFDGAENLWLLDYGMARDEDELDEAWDLEWKGQRLLCGAVDEGGHAGRPAAVKRFVCARKGLMAYKGDPRVRRTVDRHWKTSTVVVKGKRFPGKRLLANARHYQAELLYRIHQNRPKAEGGNNSCLFLPEGVGGDFLGHLSALQPNKRVRYGDQLDNWSNNGRADHWFDAVKQILVIRDARLHRRESGTKQGGRVAAAN